MQDTRLISSFKLLYFAYIIIKLTKGDYGSCLMRVLCLCGLLIFSGDWPQNTTGILQEGTSKNRQC